MGRPLISHAWRQTEPSPMRASLTFGMRISVGEDVSSPRTRIRLVHRMVPRQCAGNALRARSGVLYRAADAAAVPIVRKSRSIGQPGRGRLRRKSGPAPIVLHLPREIFPKRAKVSKFSEYVYVAHSRLLPGMLLVVDGEPSPALLRLGILSLHYYQLLSAASVAG
jgi:hypothetical protein